MMRLEQWFVLMMAACAAGMFLMQPSRTPVRDKCAVLRWTLKLAPECGDAGKPVFPLLITGTGRSGTLFASETLRAKGYDIAHDNQPVGKHGAAAWPLALRETGRGNENTTGYAFAGFAQDRLQRSLLGPGATARFAVVLHQVREPLSCIASRADRIGRMVAPIAYSNPHLFRDVLRYAPCFPPSDELQSWYADRADKHTWTLAKRLRVALFHYVFWNDFVDAYADHTYRVEDFDVDTIVRVARLGPPSEVIASRKKATGRPPKRNHFATKFVPTNLSWADLAAVSPAVATCARRLARSYGYDHV